MIHGVDVSAYQRPSQWRGLHPSFVFVKASEGEHAHDEAFAGHVAQAAAGGAMIGAYHFGWPLQDVEAEFANFTRAISGAVSAGRIHLLALDLEPYADRRNTKGLTAAQIQAWARRWVTLAKAKFPHIRVGLYTSQAVFGMGWVPTNPDFYWVAAYPVRGLTYSTASARTWPAVGTRYAGKVKFWQFTSDPLDMDLGKFPDPGDLWKWAAERAPAPAHHPRTYTVKQGDTMSEIAAHYGVSLRELVHANPQIHDPDVIHPGQHLTIPGHA